MKILAVEDDEVSRYLLEKILSSESYEVVSAKDGVEGLDEFRKGDFDMVILDWMMPRMDGIELCMKLRKLQEPTGKRAYVLMVTAKTQTDDMLEALMGGVDDFLSKPYNKDTLLSRIRIGIDAMARKRGGEKESRENPVVAQLSADHATLRSMASILDFVRGNIEDDLPRDLLKWCCSTAFLLNLDVHIARENRYTSRFLENLMEAQGDWFEVIAGSSLAQLQEEHEELERMLTEFQGGLEVYIQRRREMLEDVTGRIQEIVVGTAKKDSDKDLRGLAGEIEDMTEVYFASKKEAAAPIQELLESYIKLLGEHQEREEKFFFPFTKKYLGPDDLRHLKREFDGIVDDLGKARVNKEMEKVDKLVGMIAKGTAKGGFGAA